MDNKLLLMKINSIEVISKNLEKLLSNLNTETLSVSINVYNHNIDTLHGTSEKFDKAISQFSSRISTLHKMCNDIDELISDKSLIKKMYGEIRDIEQYIKYMKYKVFTLRKAVETAAIVDISVVSKAFIEDIKNLSKSLNNLRELDTSLRYQLTI